MFTFFGRLLDIRSNEPHDASAFILGLLFIVLAIAGFISNAPRPVAMVMMLPFVSTALYWLLCLIEYFIECTVYFVTHRKCRVSFIPLLMGREFQTSDIFLCTDKGRGLKVFEWDYYKKERHPCFCVFNVSVAFALLLVYLAQFHMVLWAIAFGFYLYIFIVTLAGLIYEWRTT